MEPFAPADRARRALAYRYEGFWEPMDTIKDKQRLDALARERHARRGDAPGPTCGARALMRPVLRFGRRTELDPPRARARRARRRHRDRLRGDACSRSLRASARARGHAGWCSAREGEREREARASADAFLGGGRRESTVVIHGFRDGYFPYDGGEVKDVFGSLKADGSIPT